MPARPIYLDHASTTPVDPRVLDAMLPYLTERFGNAASKTHSFGWTAEAAVDKARGQVAALVGASPREIIFTSGATESDNLAIRGVALGRGCAGHIVTTAIEHKAVLDTCGSLELDGWRVTRVEVGPSGVVDPEDIDAAIEPDTALVSVMAVNNEIGTVQPLLEIGQVCAARGVLLHTDAAQAAGKVPLDVRALGVHLASLSAHKMYGPKGIGALYVRRRDPKVTLTPLLHGGGHERGLRPGTPNVPAIAGFGAAAAIGRQEMDTHARRVGALRDRLERGLVAGLPDVTINGDPTRRAHGITNLSFAGIEAEPLLLALQGIALASGSACMSATLEPSYVLRALGVSEDLANNSIRFSVGRDNTTEEIDVVIGRVGDEVLRLRKESPTWNLYEAEVSR